MSQPERSAAQPREMSAFEIAWYGVQTARLREPENEWKQVEIARKHLEAVLHEYRALRVALLEMRMLAGVSTEGDPWYAENEGIDADAIFRQAREALGEEPSSV